MTGKKSFRSLTLEQPVVDAFEYEVPPGDDLVEEYPDKEPEIVVEVPKVEPVRVAKVAIPVSIHENLATAKALKSCKKFIGKWIELKAGKTITDTKAVISHLRIHGLVE